MTSVLVLILKERRPTRSIVKNSLTHTDRRYVPQVLLVESEGSGTSRRFHSDRSVETEQQKDQDLESQGDTEKEGKG